MDRALSRYEIQVRGIVQGVGFRPFVYRLAASLGLAGFVRNAGSHVFIAIEGYTEDLDSFVERLKTEHPPLARITELAVLRQPIHGHRGFAVEESAPLSPGGEGIYISPDLTICGDCRRELLDPSDRRYYYPLINCTNCGPRFTIVDGVPYDRARTTMRAFPLCPDCSVEYKDPANRRYHAEPIACPVCGPRVSLISADGSTVLAGGHEAVSKARAALIAGKVLAVKGLGGFHLACNALDDEAVRLLRRRKARDEKPFAVMAANIDIVEQYCSFTDDEGDLLCSPTSPIVLLARRAGSSLPEAIAPGNPSLGVMLPYTPLHVLLFADNSLELLVMTSGNISGEPICYRNEDAFARLSAIADAFLIHNREIHTRADDSIVRVMDGQESVIRRSRGYVPLPVTVKVNKQPPVLACGGHLKNTFCLNRGSEFYLSHHIGDLENMETLDAFKQGISLFEKILDLTPAAVAHDLHPNYLSTQYAKSLPIPQIGVQHHRAHIGACIADNGLEGEVIGVAFDGTGYGDDGHIWGGEFFIGDLTRLDRIGHLEYVPIPGGDSAMAEPWKTACGYLAHTFGNDFDIPGLLQEIPIQNRRLIAGMLTNKMNVYRTSSAGRLFDAAAALCGIRTAASYEGQAAVELEYAGARCGDCDKSYPLVLDRDGPPFTLRTGEIIRGLVADRLEGIPAHTMAMRFHETMARLILEGCIRSRKISGLRRVALSGGVFQNSILVGRTLSLLESAGFAVYRHRKVPANDGGLALGQAVLALATLS